jgi:hypothetical protein
MNEKDKLPLPPKKTIFGQLSSQLLIYFNKRRTVKYAKVRSYNLAVFLAVVTLAHSYRYLGDSSRLNEPIKKEAALLFFPVP